MKRKHEWFLCGKAQLSSSKYNTSPLTDMTSRHVQFVHTAADRLGAEQCVVFQLLTLCHVRCNINMITSVVYHMYIKVASNVHELTLTYF